VAQPGLVVRTQRGPGPYFNVVPATDISRPGAARAWRSAEETEHRL